MGHMKTKETIGERIKRLRLARGWNQVELGKIAGEDKSWISNIETGRRSTRVNTEKLKRVADALEVSLDELLGEEAISRGGGITLDDDPRFDHRDALIALVSDSRDKREIKALLEIRRLREGEGETMAWWSDRLDMIHETLVIQDAKKKALAEKMAIEADAPRDTTAKAEALKTDRAAKKGDGKKAAKK